MIISCYSIKKEKYKKLKEALILFNINSIIVFEKNEIVYVDVFFETLKRYEDLKYFINKLENI